MNDDTPGKRPTSPKIHEGTKVVVHAGVVAAGVIALCVWFNTRLSAVEVQLAGVQSSVNILLNRNGVTANDVPPIPSANDPTKVAATPVRAPVTP